MCDQGRRCCKSASSLLEDLYTKVWVVVHSTDYEGRLEIPLLWMLAHSSREQLGVRREGDGSPLTEADRNANELVDAVAKAAAEPRRRTQQELAAILERAAEMHDMGRCTGSARVKANDSVCRDSSGQSDGK